MTSIKQRASHQKILHMGNESSDCKLSTESFAFVACCHHNTCGRWYRNYLNVKRGHINWTAHFCCLLLKTLLWIKKKTVYCSEHVYLCCGEECSQDTGLVHGSMPNPRSFRESHRSFYTEYRSCTPTEKQHCHIYETLGMFFTLNIMDKLWLLSRVLAIKALPKACCSSLV